MELVPLGTLAFDMRSVILPGTPAGTRVVVEFQNCRLEGPRIVATQKGVAGDWLVVGPDATATLDVRIVLETSDGALIYVHGAGRTDAGDFARGGAMWFTPLFETGDARYAWMNKIQAIAKGKAEGQRAVFEVFEAR